MNGSHPFHLIGVQGGSYVSITGRHFCSCIHHLLVASGLCCPYHAQAPPGLVGNDEPRPKQRSTANPPEVLARLSPDRRAKMEAALAASRARAAKPHVSTECITAESLQRGIDLDEKRGNDCQERVVSSSSSEMDIQIECKGPQLASSGNLHLTATGAERLTSIIHMNLSDGAQNKMTMRRVIEGKWIAADCGTVKPRQ
jgi:Protein of unknown function (DUF3617)